MTINWIQSNPIQYTAFALHMVFSSAILIDTNYLYKSFGHTKWVFVMPVKLIWIWEREREREIEVHSAPEVNPEDYSSGIEGNLTHHSETAGPPPWGVPQCTSLLILWVPLRQSVTPLKLCTGQHSSTDFLSTHWVEVNNTKSLDLPSMAKSSKQWGGIFSILHCK